MTEPASKPDVLVLPGLLGDVQRWCGDDIAIALAKEWGGKRRFVARNPKKGDALAELIGLTAARVIASHIGGDRHLWPSGRTQLHWYEARQLRRRGWLVPRIAEQLRLGENRVYRLVRGVRPEMDGATPEEPKRLCPVCGRKAHRPRRPGAVDANQFCLEV